MILQIVLGLIVVLLLFVGYVMTREGKFRYERSGLIRAPAEKIFPYISDLRKGSLWSPYEQMDPNMKVSFIGNGRDIGSIEEFASRTAGSGRLEILRVMPNESVDLRLLMIKPFAADNLIEYRLKPEGGGTRFTWSMSGDGGFMGKLMNVFIDCEKMVTKDFEKGVENLRQVVESGGSGASYSVSEKPEPRNWSAMHYLFVEKEGPFETSAKAAWGELIAKLPEVTKNSKILGRMALYKVSPKRIYRAGFSLEAEPERIPEGFKYEFFAGGKYERFLVTGSYSHLGEASGRVHGYAKDHALKLRSDFFIENYLNDPTSTPEEKLETEILVPVK